MKLDEHDRAEVLSQFRRWQEAKEEETEAASRVSLAEEELRAFGVDPNDPPDWLDD